VYFVYDLSEGMSGKQHYLLHETANGTKACSRSFKEGVSCVRHNKRSDGTFTKVKLYKGY
jgi:hypothetical protein